ncbi:Fur family transcriptional regulator [Ilumatobacter sp.]|uniref:Fur family transcriptional regulator n=1 Tax=Ilumatobacter sp. TaxID=1967498 RepID=UPI003C3A6509
MRPEGTKAIDGRPWAPDEAADALRAHGCRATRPRVAVLSALLEHGGTISAAELTALAQEIEPGLHEATVYRTVNVLTEVGIASHVHAGHGPSLVRLAGDERLVAVCENCRAIVPVPIGAVSDLVDGMARQTGFALEPGHFALEGVCAECAP